MKSDSYDDSPRSFRIDGIGEFRRDPQNGRFSITLTNPVEGQMSEAWMIELLGAVRDVARANAMNRLAEHLDDAMLLAASEFHEASRLVGQAHVDENTDAVRGSAFTGVH